MVAGVVAGLVGLGLMQLVAAPFGATADPRKAIGRLMFPLVPIGIRDWAIHTFGSAENFLLMVSVAVSAVVALVTGLAGMYEVPTRRLGSVAIVLLGAAGCVAVLAGPAAGLVETIPTLVGTSCAVVALRWLTPQSAPSIVPVDRLDTGRRNSLTALSFLGLGVAAGVGASTRTCLSQLQSDDSAKVGDDMDGRVFNVKEHGIVGDGVTDDSVAIQALIDRFPESGGTLLFPSGTYALEAALACHKPVVFRGIGSTVSILRLRARTDLLVISSTTGVSIENLQFDGNCHEVGVGSGQLVNLTDVANASIRNCSFRDAPSAAISLTRVENLWIEGNRLTNVYYAGIRLQDPTPGHYNTNVWISYNYFDNCTTSDVGGNAAIQAHGTGIVSHCYLNIVGNVIRNPRIVGIGLDSLDRSRVTGNVVVKDQTCSNGETIAFTGSENVISENFCYNLSTSAAAAILYWGVYGRTNDKNQIINNRLTNAGQGVGFTWGENGAEINDLAIHGNHCYGNKIGIQSWNTPAVTSGVQSAVVIANNILLGNLVDALNLVQNGAGGISGEPIVLGQLAPDYGDAGRAASDLKVEGAWNTGHLVVGSTHLWVDSDGDLRTKSSAPTSDKDGGVIGIRE